MKNEYRIVRDGYNGYEAQFRTWYWPFWRQCFFTNTSGSIEAAEKICRQHAAECVKYIGRLP